MNARRRSAGFPGCDEESVLCQQMLQDLLSGWIPSGNGREINVFFHRGLDGRDTLGVAGENGAHQASFAQKKP